MNPVSECSRSPWILTFLVQLWRVAVHGEDLLLLGWGQGLTALLRRAQAAEEEAAGREVSDGVEKASYGITT